MNLQNRQVQIPGVAQPISLSLAGATAATGNMVATANQQTNLQIGESKQQQQQQNVKRSEFHSKILIHCRSKTHLLRIPLNYTYEVLSY